MSDVYYTVGEHGPPAIEDCPHGVMWRPSGTRIWFALPDIETTRWQRDRDWYPIPAPPTKKAPAPEPVQRWGVVTGPSGRYGLLSYDDDHALLPIEAVEAAAARLNWEPDWDWFERVLRAHATCCMDDRTAGFVRRLTQRHLAPPEMPS